MPAPHETSAPPAMSAEVASLCARARLDESCLYGQLLRENVADVLWHSFPWFSARLGLARLDEMASAFLADHSARRPQFHHIATEFVEFAQRQLALPPSLMALLEYEWVLLETEIDPARVTTSCASAEDLATDALVVMNPTLRLVLLPVDVTREAWPDAVGDGATRCAHAVWRAPGNDVAAHSLTYQDCLLIDIIRGGDPIGLHALVELASSQFSEMEVRQWVARGADFDLLYLVNHQ